MEQPKHPAQMKLLSRRVLLISGGVVLFFALYLLIFLVPDAIQAMSGPAPMTLSLAAGPPVRTGGPGLFLGFRWEGTLQFFAHRGSRNNRGSHKDQQLGLVTGLSRC